MESIGPAKSISIDTFNVSQLQRVTRSRRLYRFLFFFLLIFGIPGFYIAKNYSSFQEKARAKEGLTLLNSYYVAAKATEAEQGVFPGSLRGAGFNPAGELHYKIYESSEEIPENIKWFIPASFFPYQGKDNFKILTSSEISKNKYHLCTLDSKKTLSCIFVTPASDN